MTPSSAACCVLPAIAKKARVSWCLLESTPAAVSAFSPAAAACPPPEGGGVPLLAAANLPYWAILLFGLFSLLSSSATIIERFKAGA